MGSVEYFYCISLTIYIISDHSKQKKSLTKVAGIERLADTWRVGLSFSYARETLLSIDKAVALQVDFKYIFQVHLSSAWLYMI